LFGVLKCIEIVFEHMVSGEGLPVLDQNKIYKFCGEEQADCI
jgi:hypothetical protein